MNRFLIRSLVIALLALGPLLGQSAKAEEEAFDLEAENKTTVTAPPSRSTREGFKILGRVDLTYDKSQDKNSRLDNNHFLLFLKATASPKVSFMGEFVNTTFFNVDYKINKDATLQFGKILVPFGDSRYFHRYYGGLQGYGAQGVMFPNIWASPGMNLNLAVHDWHFDFYWVDAVKADSDSQDVSLHDDPSEKHQALGLRAQNELIDKIEFIASFYGAEYWPGRPIYLGGLDLNAAYGVFGLKNFRFSLGAANAWIEGSPTGRNFQKYGDYLQIATNYFTDLDIRMRYGTYDDDDRTDTVEDTQSLNFGVSTMVDVVRVLVEHQFNYEAVNETDNDITRIMASLDF